VEALLATHTVHFQPGNITVEVPSGTLLADAAVQAGFNLNQPCGGQGRCGRCAVRVDLERSAVRRRSTLRLAQEDVAAGYALACQAVVEGDAWVEVPPQEIIERRLTTQKAAARIQIPFAYDCRDHQSVQRVFLRLDPPDLSDQTDDWARLSRALTREGLRDVQAGLTVLRTLGRVLRQAEWEVTAVVALDTWDHPDGPPRLLALLSGDQTDTHYGAAVDIGTTTVTVWLVDLLSGEVVAQAADYNGQIARGEDVISRIIYANKGNNLAELQGLVVSTINRLMEAACQQAGTRPYQVTKVTIAGNTTMMHLLLGISPDPIRLAPFVPIINHIPSLTASELGLGVHPEALIDCLPGVGSYVGADISAGVLSTRMDEAEELTLFIDVGTNGEMVLGTNDWLITCACSAGPAFEGAGVEYGMRATTGAIEEVWIHNDTGEPTYRVIGKPGERPKGICGSGLLGLLAELFVTGIMDKRGNLNLDLPARPDGRRRVREGGHGPEYVVAWREETANGRDIVFTKVDIDNLLRAKAAIYGGFNVLAQGVGVDLADVNRLLIGGSFGQYINVEKAVQIGLLPDLPAPPGAPSPWDRFQFLGNTAIRGAYMALLRRDVRSHLTDIAGMMTYLELSADNTFYDAFTSALFLPHTDLTLFPSVENVLAERRDDHGKV
jgi:uncharacterized 2Fe-2S/4Fe-4S cluster protein (DUF4445 family)